MSCDNSGRGGAVNTSRKAGDGDVVAADGAQGVEVVIVEAGGESGMQLVKGCLCGGHLQGEGADPTNGVVGVGEGHVFDIKILY